MDRIRQLKCGDPSREDTQIGCLISEKAAIKVEKEVELTLKQGGKLLMGGKRNGAFYEPTVITDIPKTADVAKDMEIFGPVVSIIGFDTDEEAIEIANASKFGLSSCVFLKRSETCLQSSFCYGSRRSSHQRRQLLQIFRNAFRRLEAQRHRNRRGHVHLRRDDESEDYSIEKYTLSRPSSIRGLNIYHTFEANPRH